MGAVFPIVSANWLLVPLLIKRQIGTTANDDSLLAEAKAEVMRVASATLFITIVMLYIVDLHQPMD